MYLSHSPPQRSRVHSRPRTQSRAPVAYATKGWVSRYRPGLPVSVQGESARESIMQSELRHREKEFCDPMDIRVFCVTWNVNGREPKGTLDDLLLSFNEQELPPDIYAIG